MALSLSLSPVCRAVSDKVEEVDTAGWNAQEKDYSFAYVPEDKESVRVLVKCSALGSDLCVDALSKDTAVAEGAEDKEPVTVTYAVDDYARESEGDMKSQFKALSALVAKLGELEKSIREQFAAAPPAQEETPAPSQSSLRVGEPSTTPGDFRPPPGFCPGAGGSLRRPQVPYVGADDLVPPGMRAPGMPFPGPPGGVPLGGPLRGSQVGPNDPIFGDRRMYGGTGRGGPGRLGPGTGRWDPIMPPGMRGFNPQDFQSGRGGAHPDIGQPPEGPGGMGDYMFG